MNPDLGECLLIRALNAISSEFGLPAAVEPAHTALAQPGATFVTLTLHDNLRGCIGTLEAWRSLAEDVCSNARAAAFRDPRFPPLSRDEWATTSVEVSLLQPPTALDFVDEEDARRQLRPGIDGLILEFGGHCGTFLPQVWESLPDPHDFLCQLKRKAGLPADFWAPGIRLLRYEVQKWKVTR